MERKPKRDTFSGGLYGLLGAVLMGCLLLPVTFWLGFPPAVWGTTVIGLIPICFFVGIVFAPRVK